jgi:hypothetical protein
MCRFRRASFDGSTVLTLLGSQLASPQPKARKDITMRFMTIYKPSDLKKMEAGVPPTQQEMAEMGKFIEEMSKSGALLAGDGLLASSKGARVRLSGGKFTVTDGPFTEAKELIAGFAILEVKSKAEAIEVTKRFLKLAGDGESEIRQMHDEAAFAA